jgi:hypothetical protein
MIDEHIEPTAGSPSTIDELRRDNPTGAPWGPQPQRPQL